MKALRRAKSHSRSAVPFLLEPATEIAGWKDPLNPLEEIVRTRLSACLNRVVELSQRDFKRELPQIASLLDSAAAHLQAFQTVVRACAPTAGADRLAASASRQT